MSINKVSNIRVLFFFFNFPYNYKNRVLASFQTRPQKGVARKTFVLCLFFELCVTALVLCKAPFCAVLQAPCAKAVPS